MIVGIALVAVAMPVAAPATTSTELMKRQSHPVIDAS